MLDIAQGADSAHLLRRALTVLGAVLGTLALQLTVFLLDRHCCCQSCAPKDLSLQQDLLLQEPTRGGGFTMHMLRGYKRSWNAALEANGQRPFSALAGAAVRLLLWHWLQPALYFAALGCYWDEIDGWQVRRPAYVRE